jgi:hypothetical protein
VKLNISACRHHYGYWRVGAAFAAALVLLVPLKAQNYQVIPPPLSPETVTGGFANMVGYLRAQASPDECWTGLGENTRWDFAPCKSNQTPKVDQGYMWGSALFNNILYFGTTANAQCIGQGYQAYLQGTDLNGYALNTWACEFTESPYSQANWQSPYGYGIPDDLADLRPPRYYAYNMTTHTIKDITPMLSPLAYTSNPPYCNITDGDAGQGTPLCVDSLWLQLQGVRTSTAVSAVGPGGTTHNYIFVSGPALSQSGIGLNMFALDVTNITDPSQITNSNWVAKYHYTSYTDQRHWLTYTNTNNTTSYYAPVALANNAGGAVLVYTGNFLNIPTVNPGPGNGYNAIPSCGTTNQDIPVQGTYVCFAYQEVGLTPQGIATDIATHTENGQTYIFVATWPPPGYGSIYMSTAIPANGFGTPTPTFPVWTKVWDLHLNYDPDPLVSEGQGMGALKEFDGELYWGIMIYPLKGSLEWLNYYDPEKTLTQSQLEQMLVYTFRAAAVFRGTNFSTGTPTIQLLYGQPNFEVYQGTPEETSGGWVLTPNNMATPGTAPLYGSAGFGLQYNAYVWTMTIFNSDLYVGTMNWGYMAFDSGAIIFDQSYGSVSINLPALIPVTSYGADLYEFTNNTSAAATITSDGMGNYLNYGIRQLVANGTTSLIIGSANPMNLATTGVIDGVASPTTVGGWQLIEAVPGSQTKGR